MITHLAKQQFLHEFNLSSAPPQDPSLDPDLLLAHCWRHQDCSSCLHSKYRCSWCPIVSQTPRKLTYIANSRSQSSTCVPNPATWPLLTPIYEPKICPLRSERWELRGNELGCDVSTITFLSVLVAVLSTVALTGFGWVVVSKWRVWLRASKGQAKRARDWVRGFRSWSVMGWVRNRRKMWKDRNRVSSKDRLIQKDCGNSMGLELWRYHRRLRSEPSSSRSFHNFAYQVLHNNRLPLLYPEPSCAYECAQLELLEIGVASLKLHFDDYMGGESDIIKAYLRAMTGLGVQESPKSVVFASGLPPKILPSSGVIPTTPV